MITIYSIQAVILIILLSVKADELEIRLKAMENKLNQRITERVNITDVVANASTATTDVRLLLIKNLSYGMKDNEYVVKLIHEGVGLDISVKSIQRAPSVYNRAGVLTVELHSKDDKMKILAMSEDLLWLKFHKHSGNNSSHLYFCCTYISPKSSGRFQLDDVSKLDKLHHDVMKFKRKGRVMILGDINCRTGTEDDFIDIQPVEQFVVVPDDDDIHINDAIVNNCVNKHRMSEDKIVNENGKQLLNMCKTDNLFIVNGRIGSDTKCDFTCHTARGQSVVDYFIVDGLLLRNISVFSVNKLTPLSDHCSISINLRLDACATQKTESNSKVRTYYKWKETDKMIYNEAINSVEYQVQLSDIKNN